jgi:hypothetical protein
MKLQTIDVSAHAPVSADAIFSLLMDRATWPQWAPIDSFHLERPGDPPPEGLGAIRVFRRGRTIGRDEIVGVVPERRFEYVSLSGLPVRDYHAVVDLDDDGTGTTIYWHAQFFPKIAATGWLLARGFQRFLAGCANGLADYAALPIFENSRR